MPNSNYQRGANFERRVKEDLEEHGYVATRAAGSHGEADLWAVKLHYPGMRSILFIQCKTTTKKHGNPNIPPAEWNQLYDVADRVDALPIIAFKRGGKSQPEYYMMIGRKTPAVKGRKQPMEVWEI